MMESGMDSGGMDDLSDGVNKLQEFSNVLSSVTRALDKNVRRLEDQFGKCNSALKDMSSAVEKNSEITQELTKEKESQIVALQDAIKVASSVPDSAPASQFMLDPKDIQETRTSTVLASINSDDVEVVKQEETLYTEVKPWTRLVDEVTTNDRRQLGVSVNEALHNMNRTLYKEKPLTAEELAQKAKDDALGISRKSKDADIALFPFPQLKEDSSLAEALHAIVMRMHRLENAVVLQSTVNESLVKMLRDDAQLRAIYDTTVQVINSIHGEIREMGITQAKIKGSLTDLGEYVEKYEASMKDLAKGGSLRIDKREERGTISETGEYTKGKEIVNGLDAYTVEESDRLAKRLAVVEEQLSSNGAMAVALRRIGGDVGDLQHQMLERQEAEIALRKFQEENSSAGSILKKAINAAKDAWTDIYEDIDFALNHFHDRNRTHDIEGSDEEDDLAEEDSVEEADEDDWKRDEDYEEAPEDYGDGQGDEEMKEGSTNQDESHISNKKTNRRRGRPTLAMRQKQQYSSFIHKLSDLCDELQLTLNGNCFEIRENLDDTLDILSPKLDSVTLLIDEIFDLDLKLRFAENAVAGGNKHADNDGNTLAHHNTTLSDMLCRDRSNELKERLLKGYRISAPIIDERIPKFEMKRRLDKLQEEGTNKEALKYLEDKIHEVVTHLKMKANKTEVASGMSKRVLRKDIQKMRDIITLRLELTEKEVQELNHMVEEQFEHLEEDMHSMTDSISEANIVGQAAAHGVAGMSGDSPARSAQRTSNSVAERGSSMQGGGVSSKEAKEMQERLSLLLNQFKDLQEECGTFIPREEVQEALKAILYELKVLKMNTVNVNKFNDELTRKADADEMKNLMGILSSALGDMMGKNVSAAAKQRCLLCDKPVSGPMRLGRPIDRSLSPPRNKSILEDHLGPSSNVDLSQSVDAATMDGGSSLLSPNSRPPSRPDTGGSNVTRNMAVSQSTSSLPIAKNVNYAERDAETRNDASLAKAKLTSEVTILKNSMDLPPIEGPNGRQPDKVMAQYKSRIRSAGGGGFNKK